MANAPGGLLGSEEAPNVCHDICYPTFDGLWQVGINGVETLESLGCHALLCRFTLSDTNSAKHAHLIRGMNPLCHKQLAPIISAFKLPFFELLYLSCHHPYLSHYTTAIAKLVLQYCLHSSNCLEAVIGTPQALSALLTPPLGRWTRTLTLWVDLFVLVISFIWPQHAIFREDRDFTLRRGACVSVAQTVTASVWTAGRPGPLRY
jgi:hypothetical protein